MQAQGASDGVDQHGVGHGARDDVRKVQAQEVDGAEARVVVGVADFDEEEEGQGDEEGEGREDGDGSVRVVVAGGLAGSGEGDGG